MSDEEALFKLAQTMKDNAPQTDDKHNLHSFLVSVVEEKKPETIIKVGNLRDDKDFNELGIPRWNVRGALEMARISDKIMNNDFFKNFFLASATETVSSSLSREGFIVRQGTTTTKAVADITKRRKENKGMFGSKKIEQQGGDPYDKN